ncbi:MAG: nucleotidyltransferase family protein [Gammaproteobacteria bacterium]|nr:nucleotidyltransferase family protein [Gammaproteobacteria bacterium]
MLNKSHSSLSPIIEANREVILELAKKHGAHHVRVYGSMAKNEETENSDLDLIVEFDDDRTLFDWIDLTCELEDRIKKKVDITTDQTIHWYIRDKVIKEAIPL